MSLELGCDKGLVHVKDEEAVLRLGAKLDRFEHDLVLVLIGLLLLFQLVAIAEQVDELKIDQLAGIFLCVHESHIGLIGLLETIV